MNQTNLNLANVTNVQHNRQETEKTDPENHDQQGYTGSEPDPELATENDTLEEAQDMGLYTKGDEEHPVPVGEYQVDDSSV